MKRYQDYAKLFSIILFFVLPLVFLRAQTAAELNEKINQRNTDIQKLEQEIKSYQAQIEKLGQEKNSLNNLIKQLDLSRKKLAADISVTQSKIAKTNLKIQELSLAIGDKETVISNNRSAIAAEIRKTNELEMESTVVTILSEDSFTNVWNEIQNISASNDAIMKRTDDLRDAKVVLESTREETTAAKNELEKLKKQLSDQKKVADQNAADKRKLLVETKNSEAGYQKLLADELAKKALFEQELRDYESKLKFILDPTKLPGAGVLSWPLDNIYVTQQFGAKTGPHRTLVNGHNGADFRARTPLPAKAMADGVVKGTGDTDLACPGASYGRWIFIEYDNGLSSTYGHMSTINVREGQSVKRGQVVGYTGGTGHVTGPHLHVSLYVSSAVKVDTVPSKACPGKILKQPIAPTSAYLDPMYYLPSL